MPGGDPGKDIGEVGLGVDGVQFRGLQERVHRGGALAAGVRRGVIMPGIWGAK